VVEWIESIQADYMKKHTYLEKLKNDIKNRKK